MEKPDVQNYDDYNSFIEDLIAWKTEQALSRVGQDSEERTFRAMSRALADRDRAILPKREPDWDLLAFAQSPVAADRELGRERLIERQAIQQLKTELARTTDYERRRKLEDMIHAQETFQPSGGAKEYGFKKEWESKAFEDAKERLEQFEGQTLSGTPMEIGEARALCRAFNISNPEGFSFDLRVLDDGRSFEVVRLDHSGLSGKSVAQSVEGEDRLASLMALQFPETEAQESGEEEKGPDESGYTSQKEFEAAREAEGAPPR